jgi:DNA repair protein RadC
MMCEKTQNNRFLPVQRCLAGDDVRSLADHELLAIIVGSGTRRHEVIGLSLDMLKKTGGLSGLAASGIREMARNHGIGLTKAVRIRAAFEIGRRVITKPEEARHLNTPEAVWKLLLPLMACLEREEFRVLVLNSKNGIIKNAVVSVGTISEAIVHPREVFRDAIRDGGAGIIIAHNHPTGEDTPSSEDIKTTKRIAEAGKIIGIPLLDHLIIINTGYFSFKEKGYI